MDTLERVAEIVQPLSADAAARNAWVARVLGVSIGLPAPGPAAPAEPVKGLDGLTRRLAGNSKRLEALKDSRIAAALGRTTALIQDAIDAGDAGAALPLLARMEDILDAAERQASASTPAQRNPVRYQVLLQTWRIAEGRAAAALQAFGQQVLAHPDVAGGPDFDAVQKQVDLLPDIVPAFGERLEGALGSIEAAASDDERTAAFAASHTAIGDYRTELLANPVLQALELFAAENFSGLDVLEELSTALQQLDSVLDA